ncbi:fimbrin-5-like [Iris pallida]|uniref:Fimbrin-5-like n=2 Tax=Iris pallida TaxID=29817 RepID=A0AAX6IB53_IRIPA|nr:fimbrin-5-like [Iris pallida]
MGSLPLLHFHQNCWAAACTLSKRHPHEGEKSLCLSVILCSGSDAYVHSLLLAKGSVPDLGEDALIPHTNSVIPMTIKTVGVHNLEISGPRKPQIDEPIKEGIHHL